MNTGIYIRIGKENLLLEELTLKEAEEWINSLKEDGLKRLSLRLLEVINYDRNCESINTTNA